MSAEYAEMLREVQRIEGAAYSLRKRLSTRDHDAWEAMAQALGALERAADRLHDLDHLERNEEER